MRVKRVLKFNIKESCVDFEYIKQQLKESKEVYNYANYILRQMYFKNSKDNKYSLEFVNEYSELEYMLIKYIKENKQFTSLFYNIISSFARIKGLSINSKIVQGIVRKLKNDWQSYWSLLKKKTKPVKLPRYKKKYNLVEYNNQTISKEKLKLGYIGTAKMKQGIKLGKKYNCINCKSFRIYERNNKFVCEIIYEKDIKDIKQGNRVAAIDIGVTNLFVISFNYNKKGISVKTGLKGINQYFNKEKARLQNRLPQKQFISKQIQSLMSKRSNQLRNCIGYYCNKVIKLLISENINKLVIGYNKDWKQEVNFGRNKKSTQNFVCIPFRQILNILKYKCLDNGIEYVEQEESYTSKASYIDNDNIPVFNKSNTKYKFSGRRIVRGIYKTKDNKIINADLNGSLNILRKAGIKLIEPLEYLKFNNIFTSKLV